MGVRFNSVFSTTFVGPLPAGAAETVICILPPFNIPLDSTPIILFGSFTMNFGTGQTQMIVAIRRGTTTSGTLVQGSGFNQAGTAANNACASFTMVDVPGAVAGQQYALTVQQFGATAAGAAGPVTLAAIAL